MNGLVSFRLCNLTNEELIKKVDKQLDNIFIEGKIPSRHIPARPNDDFDLLVGELIMRFGEATRFVEGEGRLFFDSLPPMPDNLPQQ